MPRTHDRRPRIFISYRRADSAAIVGHIYERFVRRYKKESVFRDINKIPLGKNFYDHVREELEGCDIVLVVIGPQWLAVDAQGQSRIRQADDPVRLEIEVGLQSGATVIPVLVEGASLPGSAELPESLKQFPALAGTRINVEDFDAHIERLGQSIDGILEKRGKSIAFFPAWAPRAAVHCSIGAGVLLIGLAALALTGRVPSFAIGLAVVTALSLGLAVACGLIGGDMAARRRVPLVACQRRPIAFSIASGVLAFLLLIPISIYALFLAGPIAGDTVSMANELRGAFQRARDSLEKTGNADFSRVEMLIDALKGVDPHSGHAWYFTGETKRIQNRAIFTAKSCFRGWRPGLRENLETYQQDFHRYLEEALPLPALETGGDTSSETCYRRPKGFCVQRTAWIYHLLANDFYLHAMEQTDLRDRISTLKRAGEFATEARKYRRPEGGEGFDQCIHTTTLAAKIAEALGASRDQDLTGGVPSRAQ